MPDPSSPMAPAPRTPRAPSRIALALLGAIIVLYALLAVSSLQQKSVTIDEFAHLPVGYNLLRTGDFDYCALNPPLLNVLSALPLLALDLGPGEPPQFSYSDDSHSFWNNGYLFMQRYGPRYHALFVRARCVTVALVAALAVLLFFWARHLAPRRRDVAGLFAAALVILSPNTLAHARLVTTDAGAAAFIALALFAVHRFLQRPTIALMLFSGATLGLAQLTKFHALLLYPAFFVLAVHCARRAPATGRRRLALRTVLALLISLVVVNAGYLFRGTGTRLSAFEFSSGALRIAQAALPSATPMPLPAAYLRALDTQLADTTVGDPSYLLGRTITGGRWDYFLILLALKTPLPMLLLFSAAIVMALRRRGWSDLTTQLLLLYPLLLLLVLSFGSNKQLGLRMLLPAAPLVWLWVAVTLAQSGWPRIVKPALAALLLWTAAETLFAWPNYLPYFNQAAGGPANGHRLAADSNVDWGQDLPALARYLRENGEQQVQLLYFGSVDPTVYGIDYVVPSGRPRSGLLAVSVSLYHLAYPVCDHGELYEVGPVDLGARPFGPPIADLGHSIHLYRVPDRH